MRFLKIAQVLHWWYAVERSKDKFKNEMSLFLKPFAYWVVDTLQNAARVKGNVRTVTILNTYKVELLK